MSAPPISCEGLAPSLPSNDDISGIGVIINYVGTAGLATLLVILYYFMVYEPANDPFRINGQTEELLSRPNPVDIVILRTLRGTLNHLPLTKRIRFGKKTELFFIKSIVIMGDLQLLSGLTILISGFAQLRSGLATYYWIIVVQLAWFSCLTHLCCLTLLRNQLHNNAIERGWRLVAMAILAILDMVGLGFTGDYHWAFCSDCDYRRYNQLKESGDAGSMTPAPNDYAICFMIVAPSSNGAFASMVVAILLISLGFFTRVAKLYKPLSVGFFGQFRDKFCRGCRRLLRRVYIYSGATSSRKNKLRWNLLYLPLLSISLMGRFLLDQWSSLFLEVFWLLVSFTWGIAHVTHFMKLSEVIHFQFPDDNFDWSFGQVLSVLLLIAPVVSILEIFPEIEDTESDVESISRQIHVPHSPQHLQEDLPPSPVNQDPMDPDNDWDLHQPTLKAAFAYFNLVFTIIYVTVITSPAASIPQTLFKKWISIGTFVAPTLGLFGVILFSLSIEPLFSQVKTVFPALCILLTIVWFTTSIAWPAVEGMFIFQYTAPMQVFPFFAGFFYLMIQHFVDFVAGNRGNGLTASQEETFECSDALQVPMLHLGIL